MKDQATIPCKECKKDFLPIITASGLHFSKLCRDCLISSQNAKRKEAMSKRVETVIPARKEVKKRVVSKAPNKGHSANHSTLDKHFSLFIRQRDAKNGIVRCISCGKIIPWKLSDCGHFVNRGHLSTRWDEHNCNAQCRYCNRFDEGNVQGYRKGLIEKIGLQAVEDLEMKKHNTSKPGQFEVNILTDLYKQKTKELNR